MTLAIGMGGVTTIFSAIDGFFLRPLPYLDQNRLVALTNQYRRFGEDHGAVSGTDVSHWRAGNQVFEQIEYASHPDLVAMSSQRSSERVAVQHVSARLLPLLGIKSYLGSLPTDDVSEQRGSLGVVLSYEFWQHHFAGDPTVLGRPIFVDTWTGTVVAVLRPGFDLFGTGVPEIFEIGGLGNVADSGIDDPRWLLAIGKLKPGISIARAQSAMDLTARRLEQAFPQNYKDLGVRVEPLQKGLFGWSQQVFSLLFAAVGFVLLIACVNVANLLLIRGEGRRKEIGVRTALGARRSSLIRYLLSESILLALAGGVAGLVLSFWGIRILNWLSSKELPTAGAYLDARILLFSFGTCIAAGVGLGIIPAYRTSKDALNDCLQVRGTASRAHHRMRNFLVVCEIAVALVCLICAGLLITTLTRILHTNPGFDPRHLVTAEIRLTGVKYLDSTGEEKTGLSVIQPSVGTFCLQVLERVKNIPGIEGVALIDWLPLSDDVQPIAPNFTIAGRKTTVEEMPGSLVDAISPGYFRLMSIPILRGRGITEGDTAASSWVVVINQAMARRFWPNEDPIGKVIKFDESPDERPRLIVGVVGDVKQFGLTAEAQPEAFLSYPQLPARIISRFTESRIHKSLVVRMRSPNATLVQSLRREISNGAPDSPVFGVKSVEKTVSDSAQGSRVLSQLFGLFAGMALILAAIGIYGVVSYSVSERKHELGLRMALGAQIKHVVGLVLRQAMLLAFVGVLIGEAASFGVAPVLSRFLYGVKSHDVPTFVLVSSLLLIVSFFASYIPALKATRIDPMETLRHD